MKKTLWRLNQTTKTEKRRNWKTFRQTGHLPQQVHKQLKLHTDQAEIIKENSDNYRVELRKQKAESKESDTE